MSSESSSQPPSRSELVSWLNRTLHANLFKIQQLGNGCLYLQLLDLAFPQAKIPLSKLNWKAELELDNIQNLKLVNMWMDRLHIEKKIDVEKVARCKYQDNLEMAQWFKKFIEANVSADRIRSYQPAERRSNVGAGFLKDQHKQHEKKFVKKVIGKVDSEGHHKIPPKTFLPKDESQIEKKLQQIDRIIHHNKSDPDNKFDKIKDIILSAKPQRSFIKNTSQSQIQIKSNENVRHENSAAIKHAEYMSQQQSCSMPGLNFASHNKGDQSVFEGESLINHATVTRDNLEGSAGGGSLLDIQPYTHEKNYRARSHPNTEAPFEEEQLLQSIVHNSRNSNAI